jgi:dolichol-phosphate mannosyltransferase
LGRKVIDAIVKAREKNSTLIGQILWVGFKSDYILYTKKAREHGKSRWTLRKKIKYFLDSIFAFSFFPIRAISALGSIIAICSFFYGIYTIVMKLFFSVDVKGFTTIIVIVLFTSGVQLIMLGVVGEYLWRNLEETRKRPVFIIDELVNFESNLMTKNFS